MPDPLPAGDLLRQIMKQANRERGKGAYSEALDRILPESQRPHCEVLGFRNGKLTLEVQSAPLFAELTGFRREELRRRINELVQDRPVAQLQFRLGGTGHV
ncbi:hypothetical protein LBMAG49_11000 [Planctomycetota bacterium]|nr:hypothetical protein LBMAG49_11000 [Planctomycetota bacterium]